MRPPGLISSFVSFLHDTTAIIVCIAPFTYSPLTTHDHNEHHYLFSWHCHTGPLFLGSRSYSHNYTTASLLTPKCALNRLFLLTVRATHTHTFFHISFVASSKLSDWCDVNVVPHSGHFRWAHSVP